MKKRIKSKLLLFTLIAFMSMFTSAYATQCSESPSGNHNTWWYIRSTTITSRIECKTHSNCIMVGRTIEHAVKCKWCRQDLTGGYISGTITHEQQ